MKKIIRKVSALILGSVAAIVLLGYANYPGYPSDVISFFDEWKITMGDGSSENDLVNYEHEDYFYNENDGIDWVVYKTPNSGGTTSNSSNTRSELRHLPEWTPESGGKLTGTLKVMQVSTTGDARVPATFSVVVGQIHSSEGHENEPLKIFYKKFPGHTKGSVFWNYEINTEGSNGERWDYSTAVWGNDWSVVGSDASTYPEEPEDGIELGEEFSYEINVYEGIMYLTFESEGHSPKTFTKNLVSSEYTAYSDIPEQVLTVFSSTGQDGTEQAGAYAGELQYFKQGSYNQTNGKDPEDNMVWNTGAETYNGNLGDQYANGSYAEVWFKEATVGPATEPEDPDIPGYPSDVISYFDEWKITLGDGSSENDLVNYKHEDYFYKEYDGIDWVAYKTPNSGGTTSNSSNTRSELRHIPEWTPETGGKLTGTLKVMQVSTTGDARVPATFSVVVGQIHSSEGHENEPLKIFYKKFPGHTKGSVFWNYEINTEGSNGERWDYSMAVWGYDWSVLGSDPTTYPEEPEDGIELGEEFSYEINVYEGIMYLSFESEGHSPITFKKNLVSSEYTAYSDIPEQVLTVFSSTGQDGTEQVDAYAGELQYFKQGAYNQTNGKDPEDNMVWNTGAETYNGDLGDQYANGSYAEVWFKEATVGPATEPDFTVIKENLALSIGVYPNPLVSSLNVYSSGFSIQSLQLFNLAGQSVYSKSNLSGSEIQLDLSDVESGSYYLLIENESGDRATNKIIKL